MEIERGVIDDIFIRGEGGKGDNGDCEGVIKGNLFNQFKAGRLRSFKAVL